MVTTKQQIIFKLMGEMQFMVKNITQQGPHFFQNVSATDKYIVAFRHPQGHGRLVAFPVDLGPHK